MFKFIVSVKFFFKTGKLAYSVLFTERYGIAKVNGLFFVYAPLKSAHVDPDLLESLINEFKNPVKWMQ